MSRMHSGQLFALLLLSGAWSVFCMPSLSDGVQLGGAAAACGLQAFLCTLLLYALRRGFSPMRLAQRHRWIACIYAAYFLLCTVLGFRQLWDAAPAQLLPSSGKLTAVVLIVVTCVYTAGLGQRAVNRAAPLVLGLLLISVVLLIIGAWRRMELCRLSSDSSLHGILLYCGMSSELGLMWVLAERVQKGRAAAVYGYLLAKAGLWMLVVFLCITAGGRLMKLPGHPFFTLAALSQPLQGQRADALYILVFVMVFVVYITAQLTAAAGVLRCTQNSREDTE